MRLLPRTLLARTFILIAGLLVVAMLAWIMIFRATELEPRAQQAARMIVSVVNLTRTALVSADPGLRRELLFDLSVREGIRIYAAEMGEQTTPVSRSRLLDLIMERVRRELGSGTRFASEREGIVGFWVSFRIDEDEYWAVMDPNRIDRPLAREWLGWALLALLLAVGGAWAIVYRIRTPLGALARASREVGRGLHPEPLPERGPDELRALAAAFNQMTEDLRRLDQDRAIVLAGVSHDLRTPLARLRLGVELSGADARTREGMAGDIEEMDRIIGQFLDFARPESGEPRTPTDLSSLGDAIARQYLERGLELAMDIQATPPAPARPLAVRRLIVNLLDNAYRHAGGRVAVVIRPEGSDVVIEILDRGPGIPPGEIERLKQPFQRLESARSNVGGSGLGLAIVERIARMHHGRFELLPRPGGGLIARVTLPTAHTA